MARPTNYIFCRYDIIQDDEVLDAHGQVNFLGENQGQEIPHGRVTEEMQPNAFVTDPHKYSVDGKKCISFYTAYKPGFRKVKRYNKSKKELELKFEVDDHSRTSHFVLVPHLRAMAVEDKFGDQNIPARQALSALKSIVEFAGGTGEGILNIIHTTDTEVNKALDAWDLTEYSYTVRPLNPISSTGRAERRSDAYKSENIGRETSRIVPAEGQYMTPNEGPIAETTDLMNVGYAQIGFKGITPDGHSAQIPKPSFHADRAKNIKEREKPRYLRISLGNGDPQDDFSATIAKALMLFYD